MTEEQGSQPPPIPPVPSAPPVPPPPPGAWRAVSPGEPYPHPYSRSTNGFAVASLVLGIIWIWGITSVLALIFGLIARGQISRSRGWQTGDGMAIAGIVLGLVGIAVLIVIIIVAISNANFTY